MWENSTETYIIVCEIDHQSRFDAWGRELRTGAVGWPWGMGWGGRWVQDGEHMYTQGWFMSNVQQKPLQYCKVISLQFKIFLNVNKKKVLFFEPLKQCFFQPGVNIWITQSILAIQMNRIYLKTNESESPGIRSRYFSVPKAPRWLWRDSLEKSHCAESTIQATVTRTGSFLILHLWQYLLLWVKMNFTWIMHLLAK